MALAFAPLGPPVLEPNLEGMKEGETSVVIVFILLVCYTGESNKIKMAAKTWIFCSDTITLHLLKSIHSEQKKERENIAS